jgi:hypothetical protein
MGFVKMITVLDLGATVLTSKSKNQLAKTIANVNRLFLGCIIPLVKPIYKTISMNFATN